MPLDQADFAAAAPQALPLSRVLGALSYALDLTEGQPPGHCLRAAWIGVQIGRAIGLDEAALADLYCAVLLKDLGCSSNAARIAQLYLTDDLRFKERSKFLNGETAPALRFILGQTGSGAALIARLRATYRVTRDASAIVDELIETRCERGASIARQLRFPAAVIDGIHALDERWNGSGRPHHRQGQAIPLYARIALLAQIVDVFATAAGPVAACEEAQRRSGTWFDPELVTAFLGAAAAPTFWATFAAADITERALELAPAQRLMRADDDYLDDIAIAFAGVVDAKSPYTHGHSVRVAGYAALVAQAMGLEGQALRRLKRAALLHDLGKLGVSNAILDKPSKLDDDEWRSVRQHPVHSERILERIPGFTELAEIGGGHHERLDGKGYPYGLDGARISLATRIVSTADVCDALTAVRPYRGPMPAREMLAIMQRDAGVAFDPACLDALRAQTEAAAFAAVSATERGEAAGA